MTILVHVVTLDGSYGFDPGRTATYSGIHNDHAYMSGQPARLMHVEFLNLIDSWLHAI